MYQMPTLFTFKFSASFPFSKDSQTFFTHWSDDDAARWRFQKKKNPATENFPQNIIYHTLNVNLQFANSIHYKSKQRRSHKSFEIKIQFIFILYPFPWIQKRRNNFFNKFFSFLVNLYKFIIVDRRRKRSEMSEMLQSRRRRKLACNRHDVPIAYSFSSRLVAGLYVHELPTSYFFSIFFSNKKWRFVYIRFLNIYIWAHHILRKFYDSS